MKLTKNEVSLRFFHDIHLHVIHELFQDVCVRTFDDKMQQALAINSMTAEDGVEQNLEPFRFYGPLIRRVFLVLRFYNARVNDYGDQSMRNQ